MTTASIVTGDQLASALKALRVKFIMGGSTGENDLHKRPILFLAQLAQSQEARLRLALIPLFLDHPEFSLYVRRAAQRLDSNTRLTLQCYYTAAVFLRKKYRPRRKPLPDYFSRELNLSLTGDPEENLRNLAKRHREMSGISANWLGTYQHAAQRWFVHAR